MVAGIGIDLVDIGSFRKKLTDELIKEVFLKKEIEYCTSQVRHWENFAGRLAAKEAAMKALGAGLSSGLRFKDIEVERNSGNGSISLLLHGKALELKAEKGITALAVSISHTRSSAIAIVIAEASETV